MLKILDRYIFRQMLGYYILGVMAFTLVAFFSNTFLDFLRDMERYGISVETSLQLIAYQMPRIIVLGLPASTFLAVLMVFSQLNANFEITAIRMNGISLNRLILPAVILGVFSTVSAYVLGDFIVPYCTAQSNLIKNNALSQGHLPSGRQGFTFKEFDKDQNLKKLIYVNHTHGNQLADTTLIDLSRPGLMQIVQAKSGEWHPDHWQFNQANTYTVSSKSEVLVFNHLGKLRLKNFFKKTEDPELLAEKATAKATGGPDLSVDSGAQNFWTLWNRIRQREALDKRVAKITYISMWEKLTLPLSCLVIVLTAIPLALTAPRQGSNRGFVFALGVLFLYYIIRSISVALGRSGLLTLGGILPLPWTLLLAAWLPVVLIALLGAALLRRKSQIL